MKSWAKFVILPVLPIIILSCATPSKDSETNPNQTPLPSATFQQQTTQPPFITLTPEINAFTPAQEGTSISTLQKEISIENISQVVKLTRWGNGFARQAVYSPDGKFIFLGTSIGVRAYSSDTLELVQFIEMPSDIGSVAISPDGTILAAGGRDALLLYKISYGTLLKTIDKGIKDLDFSPDGRLLAVGIGDWNLCGDGEIELWNVSDWTLKQKLANDLECVGDVVFSPSGKYLAAASYDVLVWEFKDDEIVLKRRDDGCAGQEVSLAFTFDERFLVSGGFPNSGAGIVCLQRLSDGKYVGVLKRGKSESYSAPRITLLPDDDLLAITQDDTLTLWQPNEWKVVQTFENISNATWSPYGEHVLSISGEGLKVWSIGDEKVTNSKEKFSKPIIALSWFQDTDYLAVSTSNEEKSQIILKNIQDNSPDRYIDFDKPIYSFVFPSSGRNLGFGFEEGKVQIWDIENNKLLQTFEGILGYGRKSIEFSTDGSIIVLNIDSKPYESDTQNLEVWATENWSNKFAWKVNEERIILTDIDISPDKKFVAASFYYGKLRIWSLETGRLETTSIFPDAFDLMMSVLFSPNGKFLASATLDGKVGVWDIDTRQLLYVFESQGTWRERTSEDSIAWSPNGQVLAVGARNGKIFLINAKDGDLVHTLKGQTESISHLLFSPDGKILLSVSEDGTVCLWGILP